MVKNLKVMLVFSLVISLFISCTKDFEPALPLEPDNVETTTPDKEDGKKPEQTQDAYKVGTGSGSLIIDGSNAAVKGKNFIVIKAGSYSSITIKNVNGTTNQPVIIKNGGQVFIKNSMTIENVNNTVVSGDNNPSIKYGFNFHNVSFRAIILGTKINGLTLQNMSFKNVGDYVFHSTAENVSYDGSVETRTEGLKILNCKFDHTGTLVMGGAFGKGKDVGFVNDVEIAYNTFENSNSGSAALFGNVNNYNVHHNIVNNYNQTNDNHNGIFLMKGAGKFHDNKFTNFQGNMIRAWLYARANDPVSVDIYNNISYNTRKYGAFELQGFEDFIVSGVTKHANAKVYNNTGGKLNTKVSWQGQMLDLYNYGGTLEYYNNLGFEMAYDDLYTPGKPISNDMINNMSDVKIIKKSNNKYFKKATDAVNSLTSFSSKHSGIGANLRF